MLSLTSYLTSPVDKTNWERWARHLKRWGLSSFVAAFLESGSAFATLGAQTLYIAQPLLELWTTTETLQSLAKMMEDPGQSAAFAQTLREIK